MPPSALPAGARTVPQIGNGGRLFSAEFLVRNTERPRK